MAFNHTDGFLDNLKENQSIALALHLQSYTTETINKPTGETQKIQKINETFSKYEADTEITKKYKHALI